jgi:hypothetical protein
VSENYTPQQIADELANEGYPLTVQTVRSHLRDHEDRYSRWSDEGWWCLSAEEKELVLSELRTACVVMPHQPRRALHQGILPLF